MDLFSNDIIVKLCKEEDMFKNFYSEEQHLRIVSSADQSTSYEYLLSIKNLFQQMLPKMPRKYIMRQVFDPKHCSLVLGDQDSQIIGAVCYRPAFDRGFIEVVFFAVDASYHISGYGTFLFNCFKEVCKTQYVLYLRIGEDYKVKNITIKNLDIFDDNGEVTFKSLCSGQTACGSSEGTEANNGCNNACSTLVVGEQAVASENSINECHMESNDLLTIKKVKLSDSTGTEKSVSDSPVPAYSASKNLYMLTYADNSAIGFFKKQGFTQHPVSTEWIGYIKDYDGGLLMEGKIRKQVNYLKRRKLVEKVRDKVFEKMKEVNDYHVVRTLDDKESLRGMYGETHEVGQRSAKEFLYDFLFFLICSLQSSSSAWPFLEPVDTTVVADYRSVIEHPMDLSTISGKHRRRAYSTLKELAEDVYLMVNNCLTYNGIYTQYYKCGQNIEMVFSSIIEKYKDVIVFWGYDF